MEHAPQVDWGLARRVAGVAAGGLPHVERREAIELVADLKVKARRAGEIVASSMGIDSVGAGRIQVVDWAGWSGAAERMAKAGLAELDLQSRPPGLLRDLRGLGGGLAAGLGLGLAGPRLIGQYDAYTGVDTLYLLAPTVVALERRHGFVPAHFRLWISLHEQTHALQFRAAPWLRDHLVGTLKEALAETDEDALPRLMATMTFLEGHADHTADTVGRARISTIAKLRRAFVRKPGPFSRLLGVFDKGAQYRNGLEFCTQVTRKGGRLALRDAFVAPEALPTPEEIGDPAAWLGRIRGQA